MLTSDLSAALSLWRGTAVPGGQNDSSLPTRFYRFLTERLGQPTSYTDALDLFLDCCRRERIHGVFDADGCTRFVFQPAERVRIAL